MDSWDVDAVGQFLQNAGFEGLVEKFRQELIDGPALQKLTVPDLKQIDVPLGQAKNLLTAVVELNSVVRHSHRASTWTTGDPPPPPPPPPGPPPPSARSPREVCQVVLLMGPPGSGKSTLGDALAARFGGTHIDLGKILRSDASAKKPPQALLLDALWIEMQHGQQKMEAGASQHVVFVNGFPRMLDGFHFWDNLDSIVGPSLVFVLEAPDDVLRARADQRGRASDEESFEDRLKYFRTETAQVVNVYHDTGRTRYIDATGNPHLVEASAVHHLKPSLVFACGVPALVSAVSERMAAEFPANRLHRLRNLQPEGSPEEAVQNIRTQLSAQGLLGQMVLVEGFPRTGADLKAWRRQEPDALLTLSFASSMGLEDTFARRFTDAEESTVQEVTKLLRSCQPLHVAVPHVAILLLKNWIGAARYAKWWEPATFEQGKKTYHGYLAGQVAARRNEKSYYIRPSTSPSLQVWLCWLAHLLHATQYQMFCTRVMSRSIGPLPPPLSAGLTKGAGETFKIPLKADILLPNDALASIPLAFIDGLSALEEAGLAPLSDPRALIYGMELGIQDATANPAASLMDVLGLFYRRFLIVMGEAGPKSKAGPSAEMDWVWHAHTTHPMIYGDDCRRLFGHVIPHIPCKPSGSATSEAKPPKDAGQEAMASLTDLLRAELRALAGRVDGQLAAAAAWSFRQAAEEEDDIITLGCFIGGGDRSWLAERLASVSGSLGLALWQSLQDPDAWSCPNPSGSSLLQDPDFVEVVVRLLSGETLLQKVMSKDTKIQEIEALLREQGEHEDLKFFVDGEELTKTRQLSESKVMEGSVISLVRVKKPPPKPKPKVVTRTRDWSPDSTRCTCFTESCVFHVMKSGQQACKSMRQLKEGDMVRTGSDAKEEQFRRVTRIWQCPAPGQSATVEVVPGCRLTTGHPVLVGKHWRRPESCGKVELTEEPWVYTLELEGHVDTVRVGQRLEESVVVAALGVFCGEGFGWNLFTRKTRHCDQQGCLKCPVAVVPSLDFREVTPAMLAARYPPY